MTCSAGGVATACCGGRREAEKMGRSGVTDSTDSGTDHNGLPPGSGLLPSRLGLAIGLTLPKSTISAASVARSVDRTSDVEDVAAGSSGDKPVNTPPDSRARPIILRQLSIFRPVAGHRVV